MNFFKIKTFCSSKDFIHNLERQLTEWEEYFSSHVSTKIFISRIYNNLLQLNIKDQQLN